jgi:NADP-dependent 3-hydroxy acid dehydrogenase YdfG
VKTEKHIKPEKIKPEPVEEEPEELFFEEEEEEEEEEELKSVGEALPEDVSELIQEETQSFQGVQTRSRKPKS